MITKAFIIRRRDMLNNLINWRRGKLLDIMTANKCWIHYDNFLGGNIALRNAIYKSQFG